MINQKILKSKEILCFEMLDVLLLNFSREMGGSVGSCVAKLIAHLLAAAALGVRSQTFLKNTK
jgi:hypothetical protein